MPLFNADDYWNRFPKSTKFIQLIQFNEFIKNHCKMPDLSVLCCSSCGCRKPREDFIKNGPKRTLLKTCQACRRVGLSLTDFAAADTL
jgi:hypothetical protein